MMLIKLRVFCQKEKKVMGIIHPRPPHGLFGSFLGDLKMGLYCPVFLIVMKFTGVIVLANIL